MTTPKNHFNAPRVSLVLLALITGLGVAGHLLVKPPVSAAPLQATAIEVTTRADENDGSPDPLLGEGTSLREAIEAANQAAGDDTITFSPDVVGPMFLNTPLPALSSNITIIGPGANVVSVERVASDEEGRGGSDFRIFTVDVGATVNISGLTISNGKETSGGGILNSGMLTVTACAISGNNAGSGGGLFNQSGATLQVIDSTISSNPSGGGVGNSGTLTVTNSTISGNTTSGNGGGISSSGSSTVNNSTIAGNTAGGSGGGVSNSGTLNLNSTIVARNSALSGPDVSGAIAVADYNLIQNTSGWSIGTDGGHNQSGLDPLLEPGAGLNPLLKDNGGPTETIALLPASPAIDQGRSNGLAFDQRGLARILDNPVVANAAGGDGADVGAFERQTVLLRVTTTDDHNDGSCTTGDCTLREALNAANTSPIPVDIDFASGVTGAVNLGSALPSFNNDINLFGPGADILTVRRDTGGAYRIFSISSERTVVISGLTASNGNAANGGGISNAGVLTIDGLTVSGNTGTSGGGIFNDAGAILQVEDSTVSTNSAGNGGGVSNSGTLTITNSTIANNTVTGNGAGVDNTGLLTVNNSTIAGNTATGNGGGVNSSGTVNLSSAIVAKNSAASGPDVFGTLNSSDFSLIENTSGFTITSDGGHNKTGVDPLLELGVDSKPLLTNNGGPTATIALLCVSPAIDAGFSNGLGSDQRGFSRVFDDTAVPNAAGSDAADMGAFERQQSCNAAPVAICKETLTLTAVEGCEASISPADLDNGSFDPEGDPIQFSIDSPESLAVGGPYTITLTVADDHENASTCTTQVTVVETTPPVAICKPATVFLDDAGLARITTRDVDDESVDNCGIVFRGVSPDTFTCANLGANTVTLTVRDASGNEATCTSTVTVIDNTPPIARCKTSFSVTIGPGGTATITAADIDNGSTDNCAIASLSISPSSFTTADLGNNLVTLTVTDTSGNTSQCTSVVSVNCPVLSALGPAEVWIGLKNSDDVGTKFDLLAEVFKNGTLIGTGQLDGVPGGSSGFNNAILRTINLAFPSAASVCSGDTLSFKLSVRIAEGVAGHRSGTARLWFNDAEADSRLTATIDGTTGGFFLLDGFTLGTAPGPGPKQTIDVRVSRAGGNPFVPFGTWTKTF